MPGWWTDPSSTPDMSPLSSDFPRVSFLPASVSQVFASYWVLWPPCVLTSWCDVGRG